MASHEVVKRVNETLVYTLESEAYYEGQTEVLAHDEETFDVVSDELVIRNPRQGGVHIELYEHGTVDTGGAIAGTELAFTVDYRQAGSDDEWTPVALETADGEVVWYFTKFYYEPPSGLFGGDWTSPPSARCAFWGHRGSDQAYFDGFRGDIELRVWALPVQNFCEWETASYPYGLSLLPYTAPDPVGDDSN